MATSLIVTTADYQTGKTQQTTFTGVNPAATAAELQTFGEMTAALSKDTFVKATRVEQVDCSVTKPARTIGSVSPAMLYIDGGNKYFNLSQNPQVSVTKSQLTLNENCFSVQLYAQTNLDVIMQIKDIQATGSWQVVNYQYQNPRNSSAVHQWRLVMQGPNATDTDVVSFTIHFDETDEFAAYDLPVEVTITEG